MYQNYVARPRTVERVPVRVDLSRLDAGALALDSHSHVSTRVIVGVVEHAWIDKGEGLPIRDPVCACPINANSKESNMVSDYLPPRCRTIWH